MKLHGQPNEQPSTRAQFAQGNQAFTRPEARLLFREMVKGELRNGTLSQHRRKRLVQYAAHLSLTPLDAGRIVTDIYHEEARTTEEQLPERAFQYHPSEPGAQRGRLTGWFVLLIAVTLLAAHMLR